MRLCAHAPEQRRPKPQAGTRELQFFHAAVLNGRPALDQPAGFEAIHETGHIRRITRQRLGQLPHRQRPSGLDQMKHVTLGRGEVELVVERRQVLALREEELHEELPGTTGVFIL